VLVAIDVRTGKEAWTAKVDDYKKGYYLSLAPLVIDGKVLLGVSGGELGARGFLAAFDAETGKELWKTYTVPAPASRAARPGPRAVTTISGAGLRSGSPAPMTPRPNLTFLGHRQRRPNGSAISVRRQSLHQLGGRLQPRHRADQGTLSISSERLFWDWDEVSPPLIVDYRGTGEP